MNWFRRWQLSFLAGAWAALLATVAFGAPRVALVVAGVPAPADWQAVLTAQLSGNDAWSVVERGELAGVWAERERAAFTAQPEVGLAAPAPLNVDRYLHFRRVAASGWIVELVNAADGRAMGAFSVEVEDLASAARLTEAAARLLNAPVVEAVAAPRVAVVEAGSSASDAALFGLATRHRAAFADEGLAVLDRALTQDVAIEQNDAVRGFRAAAPASSLLGLDYYVELSPRDSRLVRVRDGVVLGVMAREGSGLDEVNAIQRWALPLVMKRSKAVTDYLPQVEIEALEPFYRGLADFDAGRFPEAVAELTHAYRINGLFRDAYEWSIRAHDAFGMAEVAAALRRYLETEFIENQSAGTGRVVPVDGLAFLGVTAPEALAPLRDDLAGAAAAALAARPGLGLRMPEQLDRLRREFDWMSGAGAEPGRGLAASSGLFTRFALTGSLEAFPEGLSIRWTYRDTLGRLPAETKIMPLPSAPAAWRGVVREFLARWPGRSPADRAVAAAPQPEAEPNAATVNALTAALRNATGSSIDAARLRLLRAAPDHPLAQARGLTRADEPLGSFLASGWRNQAINDLPADNVNRRWLELMRAFDHRANPPGSRVFDGIAFDFSGELDRLIAARREDGPGLMSHYYRLYFQQATLPPEEFAAACRLLRREIDARPDLIADIHRPFAQHLDALTRLAELASEAPPPESLKALEDFIVPTEPLNLLWDEAGKLSVREPAYAISRLLLGGLPADELANTTRSLLFLNAEFPAERRYERAWLIRFPRSRPLAYHALLGLSNAGRADKLPFVDISSRAEMEGHVRAGVDFIADTVEHGFATLENAKALHIHSSLSAGLVAAVANHRIAEFYTAEEQETLRLRLIQAEQAAQSRISFKTGGNPRALLIAELTHANVRAAWLDFFDDNHLWIVRPETVREKLGSAERVFASEKPPSSQIDRWWWLLLRWETELALPASELASLVARRVDAVLRFTPDPLTDRDAARLFDLGLILLYGREDAAAEVFYKRIEKMDMPAAPSRLRRELLSNTHIRLAQLHRAAGRVPEALAAAAQGLRLVAGEDLRYFYNRHDYLYNEGNLGAQLSRLVVELRHNPAPANLPDRVAVVSVPTPNGANPQLHVYYRRPPTVWWRKAFGAAAKPVRVLVLSPVNNAEALDYVSPDSVWARFADEHGLLLVVPRFVTADLNFRLDHRFTHHRFAQAWSGEAVLRAIEEIGKTVPMDARRLLVHGQASGSGFASHFVATYPDRIEALSVLNGNWGLARLALPRHAPLGATLGVRYWIGGNPLDNYHVPGSSPRFIHVVDYAVRLRQAGANVEWTEWPSLDHTPSTQSEDAARAFLARQLSSP